jgi:hypothetical protein
MRKIILLGILLTPCMAFATNNCRMVEYPDHYEAICDADAPKTAALRIGHLNEPPPAQQQTFAELQAVQEQATAEEGIRIEMGDLNRIQGSYWLKALRE